VSAREDGGELLRRDAARLWHPWTQHGAEPAPLPVVAASGAVLRLADGRELIDAISSWWTCLHGHGHPRLVGAMERQARQLDHVLFAGATHEPAVALSEELVAAAPSGLSRVFFSDDGSTAVEVALKVAWQSWERRGEPQRTSFLALDHGYHGDTVGAMSAGDPVPFFAPYAPLLFDVVRVPAEEAALRAALNERRGRIAALIVEPLVQGAGGMLMHDAEFLRAARAACDEHRVLLIADEVMTGFGRTGALFACAKAGITPDLLCLAKGLTSGMLPLAATLVKEELFTAFKTGDRRHLFAHGHSMTGNPIACAVARESLRLTRELEVPEKLDRIGQRIERALAPLRLRRNVANLRRTGGIVAYDLVPERGAQTGYFSELAPKLRAVASELGVLLRPLGNVVYALPPACTSEEQCDKIVAAMEAVAEAGS
jgi:adenosylmethionine-8-amino-7-oxononanoate aminotransferase